MNQERCRWCFKTPKTTIGGKQFCNDCATIAMTDNGG